MNETNLKIQKTSKIVLAVTNITKVFCCLGLAACILIMVILTFFRQEVETAIQDAVNSEKMTSFVPIIDFSGSDIHLENNESIIKEISKGVIKVILYLVILTIVLHRVSRIFKVFMENYTPFTPNILRDMRIVFVLVTIISLNGSLLGGLVIGLALFCVIQIFSYGCELQKLSDETL